MLPSSSFLNRSARSKPFLQHPEVFISESSDTEEPPVSPTSSDSSFDEDEVNRRVTPFWPKYRYVLRARGYRLETVKDVKVYYNQKLQRSASDSSRWDSSFYSNQPDFDDDDALCPDARDSESILTSCSHTAFIYQESKARQLISGDATLGL